MRCTRAPLPHAEEEKEEKEAGAMMH